MKKLLALLLAILMVLSFAACGTNNTNVKSNTDKSVEEIAKEDNANDSEKKLKDSMLDKLYTSYKKYTSIGQPIGGKRKILSSETNDDGVVIKIVYEKVDDLSSNTTVTYNPDDNTITINDNWVVEFENNRPVSETDSDGVVTTYTYNSDGNLIAVDNVYKQIFVYLNDGKIIREKEENGRFTYVYEYEYDNNGFVISKTTYYYDEDVGLFFDEDELVNHLAEEQIVNHLADEDFAKYFDDENIAKYYYENDSEGRMLKTYTKNSSGEIESIIEENTYTADGYLIS